MWTDALARRASLLAGLLLLGSALPLAASGDAGYADDGGYGAGSGDPDQAHEALFRATRFPTAQACRTCHPDHYREWSVSQHAYAQLSPIFNAMQATITKQTSGTNGDFDSPVHTSQVAANGCRATSPRI